MLDCGVLIHVTVFVSSVSPAYNPSLLKEANRMTTYSAINHIQSIQLFFLGPGNSPPNHVRLSWFRTFPVAFRLKTLLAIEHQFRSFYWTIFISTDVAGELPPRLRIFQATLHRSFHFAIVSPLLPLWNFDLTQGDLVDRSLPLHR